MNRRVPLVTILLCLLNLVGLIYEIEVGEDVATSNYGMYQGALENGEWLRMVISGFLHFSMAHFGSNMLCLIMFGISFECDMGHVEYAVLYIAGLIGSCVLINYAGGAYAVHAGASGAIWALMTAALIYTIRNHGNLLYAIRGIAVNVLYSFSAGVSWQGHLGGGIAGAIVAAIIFRNISVDENGNKWVSDNSGVLRGLICQNCGQRLAETVVQCPICGNSNFTKDTFSENDVVPLKKDATDYRNNQNSKGKCKALLFGIVVLLIGITVVGLSIMCPSSDKTDSVVNRQKGATNSQKLNYNGNRNIIIWDSLECGETRKVTSAEGYYVEQTVTNRYNQEIDCIVTTVLMDNNKNALGDKSAVIHNFEPGRSETITLKVSYDQYANLTDFRSFSMIIEQDGEQDGLLCSTSTKVYEYNGQKYSDLAIYNNTGKTYSGDITITVKMPDEKKTVFEKTIHVDNLADRELREVQIKRDTDLYTDDPKLFTRWTIR